VSVPIWFTFTRIELAMLRSIPRVNRSTFVTNTSSPTSCNCPPRRLVSAAQPDSASMERLAAVAGTRDGFALSRIDLEQRREGNVLGVEQSGRRSELQLLSVLRDEDVIAAARDDATAYLARDPDLTDAPGLRAAVLAIEESEAAGFLDKA